MRVVLDTNVVIDLLHFADPQTRTLRAAIDGGALQCFTDRPCLDELRRVAAYPQLALAATAQEALIDAYCRLATACDGDADGDGDEADRLPRCRDADDQKFLRLAARCRAELLITRDRQLLRLASGRRAPLPFAIVTSTAASALIVGGPAMPPSGQPDTGVRRRRH